MLGDSHSKVFNYINYRYPFFKYRFDITLVKGATAQGMMNPNSKTNSLQVFTDKIESIKDKSSKLLFLLGEVDTGFVIWFRAAKYNETIEFQLERSLNNYFEFIDKVLKAGFKDITILSAPLPTIKDGQDWGEIALARKEITSTQLERTNLTITYNNRLQEFAANRRLKFINMDPYLLNQKTGLVDESFINKDRYDHHLEASEFARVLIKELKKI